MWSRRRVGREVFFLFANENGYPGTMSRSAEASPYDCNICLSIPDSDVHQCPSGHIFCAACLKAHRVAGLERSSLCPVCRCTLPAEPIRCRIAELAIGELPSACPYCCNSMPRKQVAAHAKQCDARIEPCSAAHEGCRWKGPAREQQTHEAGCHTSFACA